ncbi:MAG: DUF2726 domain-containing protein [Pseudomonadaceae bacterium]|nr:DUF2726 domain-containing protein [Pseudomonadaceae bacterium]
MEIFFLYVLVLSLLGLVFYLIRNPQVVYKEIEISNNLSRTPEERMSKLALGKLKQKNSFMSSSEQKFFNRFKRMLMKEEIKGVYIFPEICFLALLGKTTFENKETKFAIADLRPDFAMWSEEANRIVLLIEVDGNGHSAKNDLIKEEACKMLGIELVRLTDADIKQGYEDSESFRNIYLSAKTWQKKPSKRLLLAPASA